MVTCLVGSFPFGDSLFFSIIFASLLERLTINIHTSLTDLLQRRINVVTRDRSFPSRSVAVHHSLAAYVIIIYMCISLHVTNQVGNISTENVCEILYMYTSNES